MTHVLIRVPTQEYAKWRPVFDEYTSVRKDSGSHGGTLYRSADNPNEVFIMWNWESLETAKHFFQSLGLRETMQRAGVTGPKSARIFEIARSLSKRKFSLCS